MPPPTIDNLLWVQLVLELEARLPGVAEGVAARIGDLRQHENVTSARFWSFSPEMEDMAEAAQALAEATARIAVLRREGDRRPGPGRKKRKTA